MQKLRSTWLALMGGAFLLALSVSAAFGAPPTGTDGPRGQTVAAFVHELVFGADEDTDADELVNETEDEADEEGSEDDEELAEELVVEDELVEDGEVFDSHGECVSDEASDKTDEDPEVDGNHGEVVSFAAQETCRDLEEAEEVTDPEEVVEETEREVPDGFDNHGDCVSEAAQDWESEGSTEAMTHGAWVSENARYTCWSLPVPGEDAAEESSLEDEADAAELTANEERKAEQTAARAERKADRAATHAAKPKAGNGRGGGGRP
jgi:hypothetical protein